MSLDFYTEQDDFIQIFKFKRSTDEAVTQWAEALDHAIESRPLKDPFYILLDVTGKEVEFTALARQESKRIFSKHHAHHGYIAMLFEWRTSPYFGRLFFASLGKLAFKLNYFSDAEKAYQWLHEVHDSE
jgi:hypothetical protein